MKCINLQIQKLSEPQVAKTQIHAKTHHNLTSENKKQRKDLKQAEKNITYDNSNLNDNRFFIWNHEGQNEVAVYSITERKEQNHESCI